MSLPPVPQHYEEFFRELWACQLLTEEDLQNLRFAASVMAIDEITDVQKEHIRNAKCLAIVAHQYRRMERLRKEAEKELEAIFYTWYNSVRTKKYSDGLDDDASSLLPAPVLKNQQRGKKGETPKGQFSKDLVKSYAVKDTKYSQLESWTIRLKYFETALQELRDAFSARHDELCQWSNNFRQLYRSDGAN